MRAHPIRKSGYSALLNHVNGLEDFMRLWDSPPAHAVAPADLEVSDQGNINSGGSPRCKHAAIFPHWHPSFLPSVEPGVRRLVTLCIGELDCITYSSCEGHVQDPGRGRFLLRYVSIVPRDRAELELFRSVLGDLAAPINESHPLLSVEIALLDSPIDSEGAVTPGLDILFLSRTSTPSLYFAGLDAPYGELCEAIAALGGPRSATDAPR